MSVTQTFWNIIGLGLAVPCSYAVITNICTQLTQGDKYQVDTNKLFRVYSIALLGWAIYFGVTV